MAKMPLPAMNPTALGVLFAAMAATITDISLDTRDKFWRYLELHIASIGGSEILKKHITHREGLDEIHQYLQGLQAWDVEHLQESQVEWRQFAIKAIAAAHLPEMTKLALSSFFVSMAAAIWDLPPNEQVNFWGCLEMHVSQISSMIPQNQANDQRSLEEFYQYLQDLQLIRMQETLEMPEEEYQQGLNHRKFMEQLLDILDASD